MGDGKKRYAGENRGASVSLLLYLEGDYRERNLPAQFIGNIASNWTQTRSIFSKGQ